MSTKIFVATSAGGTGARANDGAQGHSQSCPVLMRCKADPMYKVQLIFAPTVL